jgi:hypothetical protein
MQSPEPFLVFTRKLNELGLRYMVSGSVAAIYYGEPRMTNDVDIIVFLRRDDVTGLIKAFPSEEFYCPPREVILLEMTREQRGHFNLIHHDSGFKADIYLTGRDELHVWGMPNAKRANLGEDHVMIAPPEYVILRKLQFYREGQSQKHLRDISRMLSGLGDDWDRAPLLQMIQEERLQTEWQKAADFDA